MLFSVQPSFKINQPGIKMITLRKGKEILRSENTNYRMIIEKDVYYILSNSRQDLQSSPSPNLRPRFGLFRLGLLLRATYRGTSSGPGDPDLLPPMA